MNTVTSIQNQANNEAAANQEALKAATDNLNALLGQTSTAVTSSTSSTSWTTYLWWAGGGLLVALVLFWLFREAQLNSPQDISIPAAVGGVPGVAELSAARKSLPASRSPPNVRLHLTANL